MTAARVFAPAKINLTLHVTGRRADGYHELDSLVVFARDAGDWITARPSDDLTLTVSGPCAEGVPANADNLVLGAARLLRELRSVGAGASLELEKHLPAGGGIGGGSSDAAAAVRALARLWNVAPLSRREALPLGADLPVCLHAPAPARMRGIGERLEPVPALPEFWLVLANPGIRVSTPRVFEGFHGRGRTPRAPVKPMPARWDFEAFRAWLSLQTNDLTESATAIAPGIGDVLAALRSLPGSVHAGMSGSGSTCWALFPGRGPALAAAEQLAAAQPDWWVRATGVSQAIRATT